MRSSLIQISIKKVFRALISCFMRLASSNKCN